jgi:hypothetical protein
MMNENAKADAATMQLVAGVSKQFNASTSEAIPGNWSGHHHNPKPTGTAFHIYTKDAFMTTLETFDMCQQVPSPVAKVNTERRAHGGREYANYQMKHSLPQRPKHAFNQTPFAILPPAAPTEPPPSPQPQGRELASLSRPLLFGTSERTRLMSDQREDEVVAWVETLRLQVTSAPSRPVVILETLLQLNQCIDEASVAMKRIFYCGSERAQLDSILESVRVLSKSDRVLKEIEEFL